jgi:hypothetical protein
VLPGGLTGLKITAKLKNRHAFWRIRLFLHRDVQATVGSMVEHQVRTLHFVQLPLASDPPFQSFCNRETFDDDSFFARSARPLEGRRRQRHRYDSTVTFYPPPGQAAAGGFLLGVSARCTRTSPQFSGRSMGSVVPLRIPPQATGF